MAFFFWDAWRLPKPNPNFRHWRIIPHSHFFIP
ncbi:hypothetical protein CBM2587_A10122 [Cupriavidus taiwanensis]|uniref:Uncharacterized protein n=1 Tax=Cupriavidus taiwanensis TaxID=164546 RepID=A0A375BBJ6_9BURK|nr:hypothetical protein CBM2587_A10122 [Cupriavidus taiwanensis]